MQHTFRTNVIFERARFNKRVQGEHKSVIDFIESLYELAETCQLGTLKEELIQDCIIVGIRNATLSQKLMQDDMLTLDKAVKQVKSSELVKEHHVFWSFISENLRPPLIFLVPVLVEKWSK